MRDKWLLLKVMAPLDYTILNIFFLCWKLSISCLHKILVKSKNAHLVENLPTTLLVRQHSTAGVPYCKNYEYFNTVLVKYSEKMKEGDQQKWRLEMSAWSRKPVVE